MSAIDILVTGTPKKALERYHLFQSATDLIASLSLRSREDLTLIGAALEVEAGDTGDEEDRQALTLLAKICVLYANPDSAPAPSEVQA